MMKIVNIIILMVLSACAPKTVEDYSPTDNPEGKQSYSVEGYTKLNEVTEEDARKYAQKFANNMCNPNNMNGTIQQIEIAPNGDKLGQSLFWQAIIVCN